MNISLPVYIQEDPRDHGYTLRPLFCEGPVTRGKELHNAMSKLIAAVRKQVRNTYPSEAPIELLAGPEDWSEHRLSLRINLRRSSVGLTCTIIKFKRWDRVIAFTPFEHGFWFELNSTAPLLVQAEEALTQFYRKQEKRWGTDSVAEALQIVGRTWTTFIEIKVALAERKWRKSSPPDGLAMLMGGRSFSGAEELDKVGRCIDHMYPDSLTRAVERDAEVAELERLLNSYDKPPTLLIGPPKVGKTAILHEYLYRKIKDRGSPYSTSQKTWLLSPQRLIAGMSFVGEWEDRLLAIIEESRKRRHTLYFDDLLGLFLAGRTCNSNLSVGQVLKPYLEKREVRVLGEITHEAFHILQERDRSFADLFHLIHVNEPDEGSTIRTLIHCSRQFEQKYKCAFDIEVLPMVQQLQHQYVRNYAFPGKAATFLELLAEKQKEKAVSRKDVLQAFHDKTGLSMDLMDRDTRLLRQDIVDRLSARVIGQRDAIAAMTNVISMAKADMNDPEKPLASFLFLGPTGVGKTECAKSLAQFVLGDESKLVRFDMNEFIGYDSVARLVGTFDNPDGLLTSTIRRNPFAVLLLDEIEKAHPDVFPLLLQVMGEGRLTDSLGRVADFSNIILVLTSNIGSRDAGRHLGFSKESETEGRHYVEAAEAFFAPEFVNRLDGIIPFQMLSRDEISRVAQLQLKQVISRDGLSRRRTILNISDEALAHVVDLGFQPEMGARALKRSIEKQFTAPVARHLSAIPAKTGAIISVDASEAGIKLEAAAMTARTCARSERYEYYVQHPEELLERATGFLDRVDEELEEFAPEGAVVADKVGSDENLYFLIKDLIRKVTDWVRDLEYKLAPPTRQPERLPRKRTEFDLSLLTPDGDTDLLTAMLNTGDLQRFLKAIPPEELLEPVEHASRVVSILRECALIHALNEALFDEEDDEFLLVVRSVGGPPAEAQLEALSDKYLKLMPMLEIAADTIKAPEKMLAIHLHGRHAAQLLASEKGLCAFCEQQVTPVIVDFIPVREETPADLLNQLAATNIRTDGSIHRLYGPRAVCDFSADLTIPAPAGGIELRRLLLSGSQLPPEMEEA